MSEESGSTTEADRSGRTDRPDHPLPLAVRAKRMFVPDAIRTRLTVKILLVLVIAWFVIALVVTVGHVSFVDVTTDDRIATIADQSALEAAIFDSWIESQQRQTRLATDHDRVPDSRDGMRRYVETINNSSAVLAVHYTDLETSEVIASTDPDLEGDRLRDDNEAWANLLRDALGSSSPSHVAVPTRTLGADDRPTLAFASRIGDTSRGLILVGDAKTLERRLSSGGATRIVTRSGTPVFAPGSAGVNSSTAAFQNALNGTAAGHVDGGTIFQYTPVENAGWIAVTTAPSTPPLLTTVAANWAMTLIALLVGLVGVGLLVGQSITSPLSRLTEEIERLGVEELTIEEWPYREDVIGACFAALRTKHRHLTTEFEETERIRHQIESSRQELERQNARLDQFASTLSHDLRNPLAKARGHTELLEMKLDDADEYADHLSKLDDAHERINSIINDVLTLTREGESVEETESVELEAIAREAWETVDSGAATLEVAESRTIEADPDRFQRALENLFRNAIDHVGEDVTVTVGLTRDGIFVQDDGPGIPDEKMGTVFDYGHTTSEEGTGLGLSIVKTIAEAHGWTVWIDGTYEDGARFVFSEVFETEQVPFTETEFTWAGSLRSGPGEDRP